MINSSTKYKVAAVCLALSQVWGRVNQRGMSPALTEFIVYQEKQTNSVLAINCHITNYPLLASNDNKLPLYLTFQFQYLKWGHTWVRNSGATWLGSSGGRSVRPQWQSSGLQTADGLTGSMDPFPRWLVFEASKLTLAVCRKPQSLFMWASPWEAWASLWQGRWLP